jgi:hypothetical protein
MIERGQHLPQLIKVSEKTKMMRDLLQAGKHNLREISEMVGYSPSYVRDYKNKMVERGEFPPGHPMLLIRRGRPILYRR